MMTSNNLNLISDLIVKNISELRDKAAYHYNWKQNISSLTVKGKAFDKEVYFHLYRDIIKAAESQEKIYTDLQILKESLDKQKGKPIRKNMDISKYYKYFELNIEDQKGPLKKPRRNSKPKIKRLLVDYELKKDEIDKQVNLCGWFCIVASHESNSVNALKIYRYRDIIEKFFRGIKWGMSFNTPGVHIDQNLIAKVHLIFLASIGRNRLLQVSRELKEETKNKRNFTVTGMIDLLEQVDATFSENSRKYERKHELSSKNQLIFDKLNISV